VKSFAAEIEARIERRDFCAGPIGLMQLNLPNIGRRHRRPRWLCPTVASTSTLLQEGRGTQAYPACEAGSLMPSEVDLRAAIENENAAIVALKAKIGEDPLRLLLQSALDTLSFVSKAFLTPTAMQRMRTPAELASWFAQASQHIERAAQLRREVEQVATRNMSVR
jgi:hypothetical protein